MKRITDNIKYTPYLAALLLSGLLFSSCGNLEKEIDLELPVYESQVVVESYLEPGKPFRLLLTKSAAYFDPFPTDLTGFVESILEDSAEVTISHNGKTYLLQNEIVINFETNKVYNYHNDELVPENYEEDFVLQIRTRDGRIINGQTRILPAVPIDSVVVEFNKEADSLARILTYITEDPAVVNYYRRMLHKGSLDTIPEQDFTTNDDFVDGEVLVFGSGYDFEEGDTVINTIFHIDREYFDFLESVFFAVDANGNPFGQPAAINSNVTGEGIGIFTGLSYDRRMTIIEN